MFDHSFVSISLGFMPQTGLCMVLHGVSVLVKLVSDHVRILRRKSCHNQSLAVMGRPLEMVAQHC